MSKSGYAHLHSSKPRPTPQSLDTSSNFFTKSYLQKLTKPTYTSVSVAPECIQAFNDLKLGKSTKYIIYKLSDDYKQIVVEDSGTDSNYEHFQQKLLNAKSGHKGKEGKGPRYAVYDFQYELDGGEGTRNKIVFISWSPDEGTLVFPRMTYASSKESLKTALNGIAAEVQANRDDEIEYATILKDISKGKR